MPFAPLRDAVHCPGTVSVHGFAAATVLSVTTKRRPDWTGFGVISILLASVYDAHDFFR